MARYVTPEIRSVREDPEPGECVQLALVVSNDAVEEVEERVEDHGGTIDRHLPSDVLLASLPEDEVAGFCRTESLESVSRSDRMETL